MTRPFIHVRPAPALRRPFAVWATAQTPKVATSSPTTFAVPEALFADVPADLLDGALLDGQPYDPDVSPGEDPSPGAVPVGEHGPGALVPLREAVPGEALPDLPDEAYGPDATPVDPPDFAPLDDAPADEDEDTDVFAAGTGHACDACGRAFATERGLATHRRQKHGKGA